MYIYMCVCVCILGRVIPKTQKIVLDAALLNTQHCKSKERKEEKILGMEQRPPNTLVS